MKAWITQIRDRLEAALLNDQDNAPEALAEEVLSCILECQVPDLMAVLEKDAVQALLLRHMHCILLILRTSVHVSSLVTPRRRHR